MNRFVKQFWQHVEDRLVERQSLYFMGGTLAVDNIDKPGGIALNLNGKGFVFGPTYKFITNFNSTFYTPDYITKLVREIYLETKGRTKHYIEATK